MEAFASNFEQFANRLLRIQVNSVSYRRRDGKWLAA